MNPHLSTDWMFRLPTVVRPDLFDAISFEDTESALARLFGGLLSAEATRHAETGPGGGAGAARSGHGPPVRFGHARQNRTGGTHPSPRGEPYSAPDSGGPSTSEYPHRTNDSADAATGLPVTRLTRGASALADVLRASTEAPLPDVPSHTSSSSEDTVVRRGVAPEPLPERAAQADSGDREPGGPAHDASGPAHLGAMTALDDSWPETGALAGAVLERLLDEVELDFHRSYGLGEW